MKSFGLLLWFGFCVCALRSVSSWILNIPAPKYLLTTERKKIVSYNGETWQTQSNHMIKINISRNGANSHPVPPDAIRPPFCGIPVKNAKPESNPEETSDKPKLRTQVLQNNWPALLP